jgi:hypothetical protein
MKKRLEEIAKVMEKILRGEPINLETSKSKKSSSFLVQKSKTNLQNGSTQTGNIVRWYDCSLTPSKQKMENL